MDVWQAGAPHLDLLAPDLYAGNFQERCELYTRRGNTLFMPEMNSDAGGARNIFLAIGRYNAIGTSPFGIDHTPGDGPFSQSYDVLGQIAPILLAHQGKGETTGFVIDTDHPRVTCTDGRLRGGDLARLGLRPHGLAWLRDRDPDRPERVPGRRQRVPRRLPSADARPEIRRHRRGG